MLRTTFQVAKLPTYTYATLPAANSVAAGTVVRASDVGIAPGMRLVSDGSRWIPDGVQVLARSAVGASVTGTTSATALASATVPGGLMGLNGSLRVTTRWTFTNSANTKTLGITLGGSAAWGATHTSQATNRVAPITLSNRNSAASQLVDYNVSRNSGVGDSTTALGTLSINTAADTTLALTGTLATSSETITLESYVVEVLP